MGVDRRRGGLFSERDRERAWRTHLENTPREYSTGVSTNNFFLSRPSTITKQ